MQAERDWKDIDAEVEVLPVDDNPAAHADSDALDGPESTDIEPFEQLEDATAAGNGITDNETVAPDATAQDEAKDQTLARDLGLSTDANETTASEEHISATIKDSLDTATTEHLTEAEVPASEQLSASVATQGLAEHDQYANA